MIRAVVVAVVVLMISATTALSFQAVAASVQVGIDTNVGGNTASSLGPQDSCAAMNVGDTMDIDVWVKGIPPVTADLRSFGLAGFGYNITFDPAVLNIVSAQNNMMINALAPFEHIIANYSFNADPNPLPATTGNLRIDYADISEDYEHGDGVLSRLTVKAIGPGTSNLHLDSQIDFEPAPSVWMSGGLPYGISQQTDAVIVVGGSCDSVPVPTPYDPPDTWLESYGVITPSPTVPPVPTPTPTLGPDDVPEGDARVSVDVITRGNGPTSLGEINDCASARVGQVFPVDIVVQDVEDLLAWEAPITYNPSVLKITGRDVKQFLGGDEGSQVFDASQQTPNQSGFYRAGAVDQADPPAPDSGSGVLIRLTMQAIAEGRSEISVSAVDQNEDGTPDTGVLLKNADNQAIGGPLFRGPIKNAEVLVGSECADGGKVEETAAPTSPGGVVNEDNGSDTWVYIAIGAAVALAAAGAGALLLLRRRSAGAGPPGSGAPPAA
jgi:hypothetical protein